MFGIEPPWIVQVDRETFRPHVRNVDTGQLDPVEKFEMTGRMQMRVARVDMSQRRRLGDVIYAYGEGTVGGKRALVVLTEREDGGALTIKFRDAEEQDGS